MNKDQKSELVVKDNALINASYNLDLVEQRLILLAILEIRRIGNPEYWMPFDTVITVRADEYARAFGTTRQASYIALKEASKTLFNRQFSYREKDKDGITYTVTARWVTRVYYADDEAIIKLDFSHEFIPLVTELERRFTSYELSKISQITSGYGLRLYEILISWKGQGKTPVFEINEFRAKLGIFDNTYKRMGQFKEKVLDKAVSQINEFTDISTTYEQHKQGRNIVGFSFKIKSKAKAVKNKEQEKDPNTIDILHGLTDKELVVVRQKVADYIAHLESKGQSVNDFHRKNIENKAIDERWGLDEYYEQLQKAENERLAHKAQFEQEQQAKKAEQAKKDKEKADDLEFVKYFESLSIDEQSHILDEVQKIIEQKYQIYQPIFEKNKAENNAHKNVMLRSIFKQVMGV